MADIRQRMCIVCRGRLPKEELIKLVREDGNVVLDIFQKKFGRGAYICKNEECIKKAEKKNMFSVKFKTPVPDSIYDEIRGALNG